MSIDEENDKLRYSTDSSGNVTYSGSVGITAFKKPETLEEELEFYGFSSSEIENIINKINTVSSTSSDVPTVTTTNPSTGQSVTNEMGSLVSNSAMAYKANTDYQKARIETEKLKITAMNEANRIAQAQLIASLDSNYVSDANLQVNAEILNNLINLNNNIKSLTTATKEQKFVGGDTSVHIDTTKLAEANAKIAEGVENQIETNAKLVENLTKKNEHLDYLKNGADSLKDTNGDVIKPREVEAKINAEKLIEQSDMNRTTIDEFLEFVPDLVTGAFDDLGDVIGTSDGFNLDFNPLSYVDEILLTDFMEHKDNYNPDKKA
jgi:hypothetical protein